MRRFNDAFVHCCAPWCFRLLSCLPGEGRMGKSGTPRHSGRLPGSSRHFGSAGSVRHDGLPWETPTEQVGRLSATGPADTDRVDHLQHQGADAVNPTPAPVELQGLLLQPIPGVTVVDLDSDSDISTRVNSPCRAVAKMPR